ncbi:AAA family ATPase [Kordiimonas laminariae]|uniref:AAA family ATPase n=1 Tax=Kordiimonas laminariae TaxID=2917717 RepID=UPI003CCFE17E
MKYTAYAETKVFIMTPAYPTLHMLCGKIASGKSTLAAKLAAAEKTVLISEDDWLGTLHGAEMSTVADYVHRSGNLRKIMGPHITALLKAGVSVVLDFPANTVENRNWMRSITKNSGAAHTLHVLEAPDDLCLKRLKARNAAGEHAFAATEEQFHRITKHYAPPTAEEGFKVQIHKVDA